MADFRENRADYRVGRCNYCRARPAFYWRADTGLRLDDVRCAAGHLLDRTSREARNFRALPEPEAQREAALGRLRAKAAKAAAVARIHFEAAEAKPAGEAERELFMGDSYDRSAVEYRKAIKRLERAASRELAALSGEGR